jgi:hypothetical protein
MVESTPESIVATSLPLPILSLESSLSHFRLTYLSNDAPQFRRGGGECKGTYIFEAHMRKSLLLSCVIGGFGICIGLASAGPIMTGSLRKPATVPTTHTRDDDDDKPTTNPTTNPTSRPSDNDDDHHGPTTKPTTRPTTHPDGGDDDDKPTTQPTTRPTTHPSDDDDDDKPTTQPTTLPTTRPHHGDDD